jgi:hypothetical protein
MNQVHALQSADRVSLHPLTIGQAIGRAFSFYRRLPVSLWLLIIVISIPLAVVSSFTSEALTNSFAQAGIDLNALSANGTATISTLTTEQLTALSSEVLGAAVVLVGVALIGVIVRSVLIDSVLTYITSEYQLGRTVTLGAALAAVRDRWLTLATGQFLFYLLLAALTIGLAVILFACGLGIGLLAYVYVALGLFITPVLTLERTTATQGLGRAWQLGRARFWALVGMLVVSFVFGFAVNFIIGFVGGYVLTTASNVIVNTVIISLATILVSPFLPIGVTILYLDVRVRLEGFGDAIQRLPSAEPRPADVLPPTPARSGFVNSDWINLALITAGVIVLLLIYAGLTLALTPAAAR